MKRLLSVLGLLVVCAALTAACGGGDKLADAIKDLRSRDLNTMVLTQSEWGSIASDFEVDAESGPQDNADAADDSIDPNDDADDFTDGGRIAGYELVFQHKDFFAALSEGKGVLSLRTEVELFETADDAHSDIERKLAELHDYQGKDVGGVVVGPHSEFDVAIGDDESGGVVFSSTIPSLGVTAHSTVVYFRIDRLSAAVLIGAADDADVRPQAETAARKLEKRIRGVALGDIEEDAVRIPTAAATVGRGGAGTSGPPPGVPDLSQFALALEDLPAGFVIEEETYAAPPDKEITRAFGVDAGFSVDIGTTKVVGLQNVVTLFDDEDEAKLSVSFFEALLASSAKEQFAASLKDSFGVDAQVGEFTSEELPPIGDQAVALVGTIETPLADFAFAFTVVRVGELVSLLNVTALAEGFNTGDLVPLMKAEAGRLAGSR